MGIEGTSSYGVGIAAAVTTAESASSRSTGAAEQRKQGKTGRTDAYRAARAVLSGEPPPAPSGRAHIASFNVRHFAAYRSPTSGRGHVTDLPWVSLS